jgi:hypothetical protein
MKSMDTYDPWKIVEIKPNQELNVYSELCDVCKIKKTMLEYSVIFELEDPGVDSYMGGETAIVKMSICSKECLTMFMFQKGLA